MIPVLAIVETEMLKEASIKVFKVCVTSNENNATLIKKTMIDVIEGKIYIKRKIGRDHINGVWKRHLRYRNINIGIRKNVAK